MSINIQTTNWGVIRKNAKLIHIKESMEKISKQMELRVAQLDSDIMTTRRDPKVRELWSRLCFLHMKGIAYCRNNPGQDPAIVAYISKPQACISFLHLSEEETCCNRYLRRRKNA